MSLRVIWLCNVSLPQIARDIGIPMSNLGGWLEGMAKELCKFPEIELSVVFPMKTDSVIAGMADGIHYYSIPHPPNRSNYCPDTEKHFVDIISKASPDIIHIHGTEFPHSLAMVNAALRSGLIDNTLVSIQGLASICQRHFFGHFPFRECTKYTLRDLIKKNSLIQQQNRFASQAKFEIEAIKKVKHVTGRTGWDRACSAQINPGVEYHRCNENLREEFYNCEWKLSNCIRHSIFTIQNAIPMKGLHILLEAFPLVLKKFPDAHITVAGMQLSKSNNYILRNVWVSQYHKYIVQLVEKYSIWDKVAFIGSVNASAVCEQYLKSHVFTMCSSIENSSNSLGEAMLLGLPCIASYVGGIMDLLQHGNEGFLYQADAPYMLADYICRIWEDDDLAQSLSSNARHRALITHDRITNAAVLHNIYNSICRK